MAGHIATALLALNAITDLKKRVIIVWPTLITAAAGLVYALLLRSGSVAACLATLIISCLPGAGVLAIARLTEGRVGAGDALVLLALGVWCGGMHALVTLLVALFFASVAGAVLLAGGRSKETELPFVPFLLAAHLLVGAIL